MQLYQFITTVLIKINELSPITTMFTRSIHVLNEEMKNAHVRMHKNIEQMVSTDLLRRIQVRVPSIFYLAFSLELSIKAALVQQGDGIYQRDMINDEFWPQPNYINKELSDAVQGSNRRNVP